MVDSKEPINVENVVASTSIEQELDLQNVASDLEIPEYTPKQFPGLVYRIQKPESTVLIFRSGNLVCTGADNVESAHKSLNFVFSKLRELQIQIGDPEIIIQNVVCSSDLGSTLNLNSLAIGLGLENIEYEPEQFPGLVYRLDEPEIVALLFNSGKLITTGGETVEDSKQAVDIIANHIRNLNMFN